MAILGAVRIGPRQEGPVDLRHYGRAGGRRARHPGRNGLPELRREDPGPGKGESESQKKATGPTRNSMHPVSARTSSPTYDASSASSAADHGAPDSSLGPSTSAHVRVTCPDPAAPAPGLRPRGRPGATGRYFALGFCCSAGCAQSYGDDRVSGACRCGRGDDPRPYSSARLIGSCLPAPAIGVRRGCLNLGEPSAP